MAVYNGAAGLERTLASLSAQEGDDVEFVVVDDGSTDGTSAKLALWAADESRARIFPQSNRGLTLSLARACMEARGRYIARQDAGDRSLPGRLKAQADLLDAHGDVVMTACQVAFVGPGDELLYCVSRDGEELDSGVRQTRVDALRGPPHHGATMFRRDDYSATGGYRLPFVVAQDIDLWSRLAERGRCLGSASVGYEAKLEVGSISSRRRAEQFRLGQLAMACARERRAGRDESVVLADAPQVPVTAGGSAPTASERARFHYFVGSCLRSRDRGAARRYFRMALRDNPFHLKSLLRCISR